MDLGQYEIYSECRSGYLTCGQSERVKYLVQHGFVLY